MAIITGGKVIEGALHRTGVAAAELDVPFAGRGQGWVRARYDFAVDGGAVSTINLLAGTYIPAGALILNAFVDVITVPTSGGAATLGVNVEGAGDIVAPVVISGAPWSTVGRKNGIPVGTGATSVKTTAVRNVTVTVGAAALTAGVFDVWLYIAETA